MKFIFDFFNWLQLIFVGSFLLWYFICDGFLGFGYGELVYILLILIFFILNLITIILKKQLYNYKIGIFLLFFCFDFWFVYFLSDLPKSNLPWI